MSVELKWNSDMKSQAPLSYLSLIVTNIFNNQLTDEAVSHEAYLQLHLSCYSSTCIFLKAREAFG